MDKVVGKACEIENKVGTLDRITHNSKEKKRFNKLQELPQVTIQDSDFFCRAFPERQTFYISPADHVRTGDSNFVSIVDETRTVPDELPLAYHGFAQHFRETSSSDALIFST